MSFAESTQASDGYELRPLDLSPAGLERLEALLRTVFPKAAHLDRAHLDWSYLRNPDGRAVGMNAFTADGTLAAHYACQPLRARVLGEVQRGLLSLNTATHPAHRGRGLFVRLASASYETAREAGFDFVVGAANRQSTPGFVEKLGFDLVRPLGARFGLAPLPRPGARTAADLERVWSDAALVWRLTPPVGRYRVRREGGTAVVYADAGRLGASVEMARLPSARVPESLPPFRSANPLRLWIGCDPDRQWSRSATLDLPERWRPSPLNWIFRDLRREGRSLRPDAIRVAALDFDAY